MSDVDIAWTALRLAILAVVALVAFKVGYGVGHAVGWSERAAKAILDERDRR